MSEENGERWTVCCGGCGFFLAMTDKHELSIQYKYKELYVYFFGGAVIIVCKGCGKLNWLIDSVWETANPERAKKIRESVNAIQAKFRKWVHRKLYENLTKGEV